MEIKTEKKRGVLLTIWLIFMLIANIGIALTYLFGSGFIAKVLRTPVWIIYTLSIFSFLNVVFTIFLFMWKKWAFFAFCGSAIIVFVMNLITGIGFSAILGLLGPLILYLILRHKWDLFTGPKHISLILICSFVILAIVLFDVYSLNRNIVRSKFGFTIKKPNGWETEFFPESPKLVGDVDFTSDQGDYFRISCGPTDDEFFIWSPRVSDEKLNISAIHDNLITNTLIKNDPNLEVVYEGPTKIENFKGYENYETIRTESAYLSWDKLAERGDKIKIREIHLIKEQKICFFYFRTIPDRFDSLNQLIDESLNSFKI